jgi:peptidoglycan/xylan/chitin deacetylase (PgdA/CDA1 family)
MPGTFYIPRRSQRPVLDPGGVRALAQSFDIGAHTLTHPILTSLPLAAAASEIGGSRRYIEDATGRACFLFAPPGGKYWAAHLGIAQRAGFRGVRTTELLYRGFPRRRGGLVVMPTTMQVYAHPGVRYIRNALKRARFANLAAYFRHVGGASLTAAFTRLIEAAIQSGGVLHLWGHSWEIEERGAWNALETMLASLAERRECLRPISNASLCDGVLCDGYTTSPSSTLALP